MVDAVLLGVAVALAPPSSAAALAFSAAGEAEEVIPSIFSAAVLSMVSMDADTLSWADFMEPWALVRADLMDACACAAAAAAAAVGGRLLPAFVFVPAELVPAVLAAVGDDSRCSARRSSASAAFLASSCAS